MTEEQKEQAINDYLKNRNNKLKKIQKRLEKN